MFPQTVMRIIHHSKYLKSFASQVGISIDISLLPNAWRVLTVFHLQYENGIQNLL